jgi:hypothetical protein
LFGEHTPDDLLKVDREHVLDETSTFDNAVATILHTGGLATA